MVSERQVDLRVEGLEHVPISGPCVLACRHFHHQWDGFVLLAALSRRIHFLVALDWISGHWRRKFFEWACANLHWPVIIRHDGLSRHGRSAFTHDEQGRYLRRASRDVIQLLRAGELVAIFPEAYPNIDSAFTPKQTAEAFLPFRPGVVRLVEWAQRSGCSPVPVVPTGLHYRRGQRWEVVLRFGPPIFLDESHTRAELLRTVEEQVLRLSEPTLVG